MYTLTGNRKIRFWSRPIVVDRRRKGTIGQTKLMAFTILVRERERERERELSLIHI